MTFCVIILTLYFNYYFVCHNYYFAPNDKTAQNKSLQIRSCMVSSLWFWLPPGVFWFPPQSKDIQVWGIGDIKLRVGMTFFWLKSIYLYWCIIYLYIVIIQCIHLKHVMPCPTWHSLEIPLSWDYLISSLLLLECMSSVVVFCCFLVTQQNRIYF